LILGWRQAKQKVCWKTLGIALYLFIQPFYRNTIERCQFSVQYDFLIAQNQNFRINFFGKNECGFIHRYQLEVANCDLKIQRRMKAS